MPLVALDRVSYAFAGAEPVLGEVSLVLPAGWTGLVGGNGAGKSTLLRLITGELRPVSGTVRIEPDPARVFLCAQEVEAAPDLELAHGEGGEARRLRDLLELHGAGRWSSLSPGERRRWQVAEALLHEPDVLLLDEPGNHLDAHARELLVRALRRYRGAGVLVSHARELLGALCTRTVRLRDGRAQLFPGGYDDARAAWDAEDREQLERLGRAQEAERAARAHLARLRDERAKAQRERSTGRRMKDRHDSDARTLGADFLAEKAEKRLGRGVTLARREAERVGEALATLGPPPDLGRSLHLGYEPAPRRRLVALDEPELRAGERVVLRDVRVVLDRGDRVHVRGANGAGKTTLLEAILRRAALPPGRVLHLPQELGAAERLLALDEVRRMPREERGRTLSVLAALGVDPARVLASPSPSPGEARKLRIATGLGRRAWLLVLDEPTNHLDLPSVERLEAALAGWPGALLLTTHDARFASAVCDAAWTVEGGRVR